METHIHIHKERCDLCGTGEPACVPACPQQVLTLSGKRIVMTHTDHCPEGCTVCVDTCESNVFSLLDDVHEDLGMMPTEQVTGPCRVHQVAYLKGADQTDEQLQVSFTDLCNRLGLPADQQRIGGFRGHAWGQVPNSPRMRLQLVWELHTEYYFVRATVSEEGNASDEAAVEMSMEMVIPPIHDFGTPPLLTCLDILVIDRPMNPEEVCERIVCRNRFGAHVLGGELSVYTNYEPSKGRERYVVCGTPGAVADHGAYAVANIGRIENYYHLIMLPRTEVRSTVQEVHGMERALASRMEAVTHGIERAGAEQMELWLKGLTVELTRVVALSGRFNHVLSGTYPYQDRVREGFAAWKEQPVEGFDSLSNLVLERTVGVVNEYRAFLARLNGMEREIADVVAILRTRVEMSMEAQNTELLKNLDTRSAIQLRLQEMAEGLSVIVISYYSTSLSGYVFKALEKEHLIGESATLYTAMFIPVAVIGAFLVTRRGMRKLKKKERAIQEREARAAADRALMTDEA
ncbi:MAG: DUF3422 family protein [Leptospirillia bacterium]